MNHAIQAGIICLAISCLTFGQSAPPKKNTAKKQAASSPGSKGAGVPAARTTSSSPASGKSSTGKRGSANAAGKAGGQVATSKTGKPTRYYRRPGGRRYYTPQQTAPTPERYREIQDALAAKGYLKTAPNGVWDKDSVDAMQRFQQDQQLEPTGKLTAKSLVALGLGPKTPAVTVTAASPASSTPQAPPAQ